jgi:hypothetical protein
VVDFAPLSSILQRKESVLLIKIAKNIGRAQSRSEKFGDKKNLFPLVSSHTHISYLALKTGICIYIDFTLHRKQSHSLSKVFPENRSVLSGRVFTKSINVLCDKARSSFES